MTRAQENIVRRRVAFQKRLGAYAPKLSKDDLLYPFRDYDFGYS